LTCRLTYVRCGGSTYSLWRYISTLRKRRAPRAQARIVDALFLFRWGPPLDGRRVSYRFRLQARKARIPYRVRFHDLRHAAATWGLRTGMPKERVSRMLGHANDAITSIYEHLNFEDVQVAFEAANPPRLILLDLMMPVMDGLTFLQQRQQDPLLAPCPRPLSRLPISKGWRRRGHWGLMRSWPSRSAWVRYWNWSTPVYPGRAGIS
jgi:hypothetical protein